jgi:hypothetical protein
MRSRMTRLRSSHTPPRSGDHATPPELMSPPADATLVALAMPLFVRAGAVNGTAFALARSGDQLYYLVDNVAVELLVRQN